MTHERYALAREILLRLIVSPTLRNAGVESIPVALAGAAWDVADAFVAEAERRGPTEAERGEGHEVAP